MRGFILVLLFTCLSQGVFGQDHCQKCTSYFKLWDNTIKSGKSSYDRLRMTQLTDEQRKAYNKIVSKLRSVFGDYGDQLEVNRMHVIKRGEDKNQFYIYVVTVPIYGYNYGFEVAATEKGKITSKIPFKSSKAPIIDPCAAIKKAEAQADFDDAVGIKLAMNKDKLTWEVWEEGVSLSVQPDSRGLVHSEHLVMIIDAYSGEMINYSKRKQERVE